MSIDSREVSRHMKSGVVQPDTKIVHNKWGDASALKFDSMHFS